MAIIVENGTNVSGANSYVSEAELATYVANRNITLVGTASVLLIQSMDYIESLDYQGIKKESLQGLQWPRINVFIDRYSVPSTTIPNDLKNGQLATAVAIDQGYNPLAPLTPAVKRERVGELEVEYQDGASSNTYALTITRALWKLLVGSSGGNIVKVSKG